MHPAILAAVLGAFWFLPAHAEKADRDKPVNIEADRMSYDDLRQINIFDGNVTLTQGTLMIVADRITVKQDPEGFQRGVAEKGPGGVAYFRQKRDGLDEYIEGWGERIEYDARTEKADLISRARILRGGDEVRGNVINYDGRSEFFTVLGGRQAASPGNPDGRVRAVIQPRGNPPVPGTEKDIRKPALPLKPAGGIGSPRADFPEGPKK